MGNSVFARTIATRKHFTAFRRWTLAEAKRRISLIKPHLVLFLVGVARLTLTAGTSFAQQYPGEPALHESQTVLNNSLQCTPFTHTDKPPVLLVHGTFTSGFEQWDWTYLPLLANDGFDVCIVTYPDRGLGDMQISAEYIVNALRSIYAATGRKVAMVGHSQGGSMPRWALKWWPSARNAVDDYVMLAGANHGIVLGNLVSYVAGIYPLPILPVGLFPASFYQFAAGSHFVTVLNNGDEAPGAISYTSIYSGFYDELIEPITPVPTAALDWNNPPSNVVNILLQDTCPGRFVDHATIGLTDEMTYRLVVDAITHAGPANVSRAGGSALCGLAPIIPSQIIAPQAVAGIINLLEQESLAAIPNLHLTTTEPPLMPYAQQ
jgi:triacylglycerol lipase